MNALLNVVHELAGRRLRPLLQAHPKVWNRKLITPTRRNRIEITPGQAPKIPLVRQIRRFVAITTTFALPPKVSLKICAPPLSGRGGFSKCVAGTTTYQFLGGKLEYSHDLP